MKIWRTRKNSDSSELMDKLLTAVVSVYLYMARTAKLKGEEINFIDRILHSMFGNDIPLYKIEQARQQVLSIREAANYLNVHLGSADRAKIILNLISLAYHDRNKIHVLGSLEIVELTDLLRLDVSSLDAIYDLFEDKTSVIDLPLAVSDSGPSLLRNSMLWTANSSDFRFIGCDPSGRLLFIMIESLVLFYYEQAPSCPPCRCKEGGLERSLQTRRFHRLRETSSIILQGKNGEIILNCKDLWSVYNFGSYARELYYPENADLKLRYRNRKFFLEQSSKNKLNQSRELALDDCPEQNSRLCVLDIITRAGSDREILSQDLSYFLCRDRQGFSLKPESGSLALLHFSADEVGLWVQALTEHPVFLNRLPLKEKRNFTINQDLISIGDTNYLINRNWELIEIPIQISEINVAEISHKFKEGNTALSSVAFRLGKGSMMAIMGPSGSGKTTLLQVLLGEVKPTHSKISIDGLDFSANFAFFQQHIGYVPQDDLLFPNLTVFENLYYRIRLALPALKNEQEIKSRIDNLLHSVGLYEQRSMLVGDVLNKKLSGGQRRRLNIALELVMNPMIIFLDEPTSGLSSKDSESIAEFLCELKEQNKIIICTIHQPNPTVFKAFDRVLLLDNGGRQVYFGSSDEVFDYFNEELQDCGSRKEALDTKKRLLMPDYFFDLIETPDRAGNRRWNPDYWERKYRNHRFRQAMDIELQENGNLEQASFAKPPKPGLIAGLHNLIYLLIRNFVNKSRSRINLLMTLLVAPLLSVLTSFVLRGVPDGKPYSFWENQNSWLFGFISIIIFIFIGLANSIDDILSEKRSIKRELKLNVPAFNHLFSKTLVLFFMTLVQILLYYYISAGVLGMRGYLVPHALFLLLSGMTGYSLGLLFSSIIKDRNAVINILPLVIIPQIMFSGAVIRFTDMNSSLRLNRKSEIPEFCHLIPSRWLYEGWMLASGSLNLWQRQKDNFLRQTKSGNLGYEEYIKTVESYNLFLEEHPESRYQNSLIRSALSVAHGDYLNNQRNTFLSHQTRLWGMQRRTLYLDLAVSLLLILAFSLVTWLRLKFFF
ncbi:hypothetical protein MASR1M36_18500 [Candidatus Cloacimonadaceae bacterium]